MTTTKMLSGAPSADKPQWNNINWETVGKSVHRMQTRIAKAIQNQQWGKVKALQRLITHSHYAKLTAVRRVTSNKGKTTPGIDGEIWSTPDQKLAAVMSLKTKGHKPLPLKRVYIPKKKGTRPLSIPVMKDRALQALHLLSVEPVAECIADPNSYGFRGKRCAADAIEQSFTALSNKHSAKYVLEGDIESCFDQIDHKWLLEHVIMDKKILAKWLKSGYIFKQRFFHNRSGTPQGGIISPCLLTITLSGLEKQIKSVCLPKDKVNIIAYADDFIVTGVSPEVLENKVKPVIASFLNERGLSLSENKTRITHIEDGFDFLGFNIRKYRNKMLIKPSKSNIKHFRAKLRMLCKKCKGNNADHLITELNSRITGWSQYYRHVVSKKVFNAIDKYIFTIMWKWARFQHKNKRKTWIYSKYMHRDAKGRKLFCAKSPQYPWGKFIKLASDTRIVRYIKIRSKANPYLPEYRKYFAKRWAYIKHL